jgi:hypothetical protein
VSVVAPPLALEQALLVELGSHRFARGHEPRSQQDAARAEGEGGDQPTTVGDSARRHDGDVHGVDHLGQERHRPDGCRFGRRGLAVDRTVAAGFAALSHDDVGAVGGRGACILHVRDHREYLDPVPPALLDERRLEPAECGREHRRPLVEHDLDRRIDDVGGAPGPSRRRRNAETLAELVQHFLRAPQGLVADRIGIDRRPERAVEPQIHPERAVGQLPDSADHHAQPVGRHVESGEDAEPARAAHFGDELGAGDSAHAGLDDRIVDADEIAQRRAKDHLAHSSSSSAIGAGRPSPRSHARRARRRPA